MIDQLPVEETPIREILEKRHKAATPGPPVFVVDGALVARITQIDREHKDLQARLLDLETVIAKLL